jgi:hypothetical protein
MADKERDLVPSEVCVPAPELALEALLNVLERRSLIRRGEVREEIQRLQRGIANRSSARGTGSATGDRNERAGDRRLKERFRPAGAPGGGSVPRSVALPPGQAGGDAADVGARQDHERRPGQPDGVYELTCRQCPAWRVTVRGHQAAESTAEEHRAMLGHSIRMICLSPPAAEKR